MSAGLIDTHAHLCDGQFDADRAETLRRAKAAGIGAVVEIADAPEGWQRAKDLAASGGGDAPQLFWSCGFHPHYAEQSSGFDFESMKRSASDPSCVAVGEIGLDYYKSTAPKELQMELFRQSLEAAAEINKPVVIHCRDAQADTLRILKSFFAGLARRDLSIGVIHCFSGDIHFAEGCLDLGFCLGVDGPITYPSAQPLRDVIRQVPLDRIVLETDSPYLPPQGYRGKRNESAYLLNVAEKLAELFGKDLQEIREVTTANARKLFRLRSPA